MQGPAGRGMAREGRGGRPAGRRREVDAHRHVDRALDAHEAVHRREVVGHREGGRLHGFFGGSVGTPNFASALRLDP